MYTGFMRSAGLTMIELLIVVSLLAILILTVTAVVPQYLTRAHDSERKSDLQTYRVALEEYYNDVGSYPPSSSLENCGSDDLAPYIPQILCDPVDDEPYFYFTDLARNNYSIYARLVNTDDPIIAQHNCQFGCGPDINGDGSGDFNTGISNTGAIEGSGQLSSTPAPVPTPIPGQCGGPGNHWCIAGVCSSCCPGNFRCSGDGTICVPDDSCDPCPVGEDCSAQ